MQQGVPVRRQDGQDGELRLDSRVLVHGLSSPAGRPLNYSAGVVVTVPSPDTPDGRFGVRILGKVSDAKLLKRENLLRAWQPADRETLLSWWVLERSLLVFAAAHLRRHLSDNEGLLLHIASFLPLHKKGLFQFGGFMGRIWEEHWLYRLPLSLEGTPVPRSTERRPRLDAANCEAGCGLVLFAGGCGAHPRRCLRPDGFFNTADLYDSLTDEWYSLDPMTYRRHGSSACTMGSKAYVVGGIYVDDSYASSAAKFCEVLDLETWTWSCLPETAYSHVEGMPLNCCSFFALGAVCGRVVVVFNGLTLAYNPLRSEWRRVDVHMNEVELGENPASVVFNGELILASGRDTRFARKVAGFTFKTPATSDDWWQGGVWRQLPDLLEQRMGGSLVVANGHLYISGGVNEDNGKFSDTAERFDGSCWRLVENFRMPRAVHAHDNFFLPCLLA